MVARFWTPGAQGYSDMEVVPFGERIMAVTLPGLIVETSGLLS